MQLRDYQLKAVEQILKIKRIALFLDMGLGKTLITLTAIDKILKNNINHKVLIIAPLRVANSVWTQEAEKWGFDFIDEMKICTGSAKHRKQILNNDFKILVTNKENVDWLFENVNFSFNTIVIDESSTFKDSSTKRFKAIKIPAMLSEYIILLSGTPNPNGLIDLWSQIFLIDEGKRLGKNKFAFQNKYMYQSIPNKSWSWKYMYYAYNEITSLIKDVTISISSIDKVDYPKVNIIDLYCNLPKEVIDIYKTLEKECIIELNSEERIFNAGVKVNKLSQLANGFVYYDENTNTGVVRKDIVYHLEKIKLLKEVIDDNKNENFLIAFRFKKDLELLLEAFPDAKILDKDPQTITDWNNKKIKILLAHPMSAGHGLNIQAGGSVIIWFGLTYSLENYLQFNARLCRPGQEKPVRIFRILAKNTIDENIKIILSNKDITQSNVLNELKSVFYIKNFIT